MYSWPTMNALQMSTEKVEAIRSPETSVTIYKTARRYNPQDTFTAVIK